MSDAIQTVGWVATAIVVEAAPFLALVVFMAFLFSRYATGMAHELNQPLTSVLGYAELLAKKAGEDSPLTRLS